MEVENCTVFTEFIFLGLSKSQDMQLGLFVFFLFVYGTTVVANVGMILLIKMDSRLHTPMYYFLSNLSFCDFCYSSSVSPKMLADILCEKKRIPYNICPIQMFTFCAFGDVEILLLAVMAYDRYVAICNPLLYTVAMSRRLCTLLVFLTYFMGLLDSAIHTCLAFRLSFCNSNVINHFFCDFPPLLALSTSDTFINVIMLFILGTIILGCSIFTVLLSYSYIIVTILRMKSAEGRRKAFSTCASHLCTVALFHGTLLYMYFRPSSSYSMDTDKITSVFYTVIIPMLNPLIYSLRNKDVKGALKKAISTKLCLHILGPVIGLLLLISFGPWAFRKLTDFIKQQVDSIGAKQVAVHYSKLNASEQDQTDEAELQIEGFQRRARKGLSERPRLWFCQ
ncbi:olfactory receptor 5W2-like [Suncus etruscus]|uniref:olfactory receptor 5W2-like n=1 Tax=Suncus etruscus TaxID=109475 RepID=UPI00210F968A|nr:olfactory receptor 5W2-like [Suncus etruscus]